MKVTLDLPEYLVREIKLRAVIQERTVKDLVAETLRQGLGLAEKPVQALRVLDELIEINAQGFPVFRCPPDAPASKMTTEEPCTGTNLPHCRALRPRCGWMLTWPHLRSPVGSRW